MALGSGSNGAERTLTGDAGIPAVAGSQRRSVYERKLNTKAGELIRPALTLLSQDRGDGVLAFGSVAVTTSIGDVVIDDVSVRLDRDGSPRVSLPFKRKADKEKGGSGQLIKGIDPDRPGVIYEGYGIAGAVRFQNLVRGEGAWELQRMVMAAYDVCKGCDLRRCKDKPEFRSCNADPEQQDWDTSDGAMSCSCFKEREAVITQKVVETSVDEAAAAIADIL